jgi:hypothetical protein
MRDRIISEARYSYILFERDDKWILTYLSGGSVEIDASICLSSNQISEIKNNRLSVEQFLAQVKVEPDNYAHLSEPAWPK